MTKKETPHRAKRCARRRLLAERLRLALHPQKIFLKILASGMDFLDWVTFINHRILWKNMRRWMFVRIKNAPSEQSLQFYLGMLSYSNASKARDEVMGHWLWAKIRLCRILWYNIYG
jgi:hypothetical protein